MPVTVREKDTFLTGSRGTPNALSPASNGDNWTQQAGTSTLGYDGTNHYGTLSTSNSKNVLTLGATYLPNIDIVCFFLPQVVQDEMGVVARYNTNGGTNYYMCTSTQTGGQQVLTIKRTVIGGQTPIASFNVSSATTGYWIHFQIIDNAGSQSTLRANFWLNGGSEPGGWMINTSDRTQQLLVPGLVGVYSEANGTASTQKFGSFTASDTQVFASPPTLSGWNHYGVTVNVANGLNATIPFITQQQISDILALTGQGGWVRYQYQWASLEPNADGNYDWTVMDYAVSMLNSAGLRILWPVQQPPTAYKSVSYVDGTTNPSAPTGNGTTPYVYAPPSNWNTVMKAVASRYNGTVNSPITGYPMYIHALQLENEDYDADSHNVSGNRDMNGKWLALVARNVYTPIKTRSPNVIVMACSVRKTTTSATTHITNWLTNLMTYQGGAANYLDAVDFHYYRDGNAAGLDPTSFDSNTPSVAQEIATVYSVLAAHNSQATIWCNEFGWSTANSTNDNYASSSFPVDDNTMITYNTSMYNAFKSGGATVGMMFTLDPGAIESSGTLPFSATNSTPTAVTLSTVQKSIVQTISGTYTYKPVYAAMQTWFSLYPNWAIEPAVTDTFTGVDGIDTFIGIG